MNKKLFFLIICILSTCSHCTDLSRIHKYLELFVKQPVSSPNKKFTTKKENMHAIAHAIFCKTQAMDYRGKISAKDQYPFTLKDLFEDRTLRRSKFPRITGPRPQQ